MKTLPLIVALALSGCVAPVGPVEVTRFHVPDAARLGRGAVAVEPAPGMVGDSLEWRTYAAAVGRELQRAGYREQSAGTGDQVALVRLRRQSYRPERNRGPVSVGVGGSTGSYGSGLGLGIGFDLSGPPPEVVETELAVTIKDGASGQALWEGRASFVVTAKSPLANSQLGAAKMAEALFKGFPGNSGETIQVK
ncbi:MAG: DUF4136 domain-containing protein [Sphingomonadales bacterium]|nr:DUF4136 domain-containing protein [Sphingomonadales bacterium]